MKILYTEITRDQYLWNIKINKPEQDVVGDQLILKVALGFQILI